MKKLIPALVFLCSILIFSQVNTEQYRKDSVKLGFTGNLNFEAVAITGNTDFQLLDIGGRLNYNYGDDYTFLILDAGYGWESGDPFVDQLFAHLRHVITPLQFYQLELFTQYDNNKKRLLLSRELLGGGIRLRLLTEDNFKLRVGLAYMFEAEDYDLPASSIHGSSTKANRMSSYITFNYDIEENLSFVSVTYYQPKLDEWNDYKIVSENAFVVDPGGFIDLYLKFNLRYDSFPPDGIKKTDTVTKMGISFKF
jgi:putative salt-induced outer membrane protein YdiY